MGEPKVDFRKGGGIRTCISWMAPVFQNLVDRVLMLCLLPYCRGLNYTRLYPVQSCTVTWENTLSTRPGARSRVIVSWWTDDFGIQGCQWCAHKPTALPLPSRASGHLPRVAGMCRQLAGKNVVSFICSLLSPYQGWRQLAVESICWALEDARGARGAGRSGEGRWLLHWE